MKYIPILLLTLSASCKCISINPQAKPHRFGWFKSVETGKVCILAPDGAIVYSYYEPTKTHK